MLKLLKFIIVGLIPFVILELLVQFIFSFFNQSLSDPRLTFLNFGGPFLLPIVFILIAGQRLLFKKDLIERLSLSNTLKLFFVAFMFLILSWQIWYLLILYKNRGLLELTEFGPMLFGLGSTLFLAVNIARKKNGY